MISISGIDQLDEYILNNKNNDKILLLYFGADRCSPCNILKNRINKECENEMQKLLVFFIDVDLQENDEIVDLYDIRILPTQIFIRLKKNKVKINDRIDGYDWIKLTMSYNKIANNSTIML